MESEYPTKNKTKPNIFDDEEDPECIEYLQSLDDKHIKAYCIAKEHLKSSFDLRKSNGFLRWMKKKTGFS
jgi:hypothetical protein